MKFNRVLFSSARDDWETPDDLYEALNQEFRFTDDPCPANHRVDGLQVDWGERVYVNPPYGRSIEAWFSKAGFEMTMGRSKLVVFLLPARTDTKWFHRYVLPFASEIRFLKGRLKFKGAKTGAPFPSMVVIFR